MRKLKQRCNQTCAVRVAESWRAIVARSVAVGAGVAVLVTADFADGAPLSPIVKGPYLQELSSTEVVVRAEVDPPGPVTVRIESPGKPRTIEDTKADAWHSVRVDGLTPKTTYRYSMIASGAKTEGTFTTAPSNEDTAPISFLVYGDNRTDAIEHGAIVRAMQTETSDFLINTGDFVDDGSQAAHWQVFFDVESPMLKDRCVFAAVGNHELAEAGAASFLRYFGTEHAQRDHRLDDTMRWSMVRFFFINGWGSLATGPDRDWLDKALADADAEPGVLWRFLVVHHGPYSSSLHGPNDKFQTGELVPLLLKHKIDLVISGHDHVYERGNDGLLRYVVSGGGGAPLYPVNQPLPQTKKAVSEYHYIRVTVSKDQVSLVAKRPNATRIEEASFTAKSQSAWDGEPPITALAPAATSTSPPAAPQKKDDCACDVRGDERTPTSGLLGVGLAALALLRRRLDPRARSALR